MNKDEKNLISKESYKRYVFLRDQHKYNDSQIAKLIGSDSSRFTDWKKNSLPNAVLLVRIAAILNTSVEYLITGEEPKNDNKEHNEYEKMKKDHIFMDNIKILFHLSPAYQKPVYDQIELQQWKEQKEKESSLGA